jgi:hypothetical protein
MVIKRVCAWCGISLGYKECENLPHKPIEELVSHSICPKCFEKTLAEIKSITAVNTNANK